LHMNVFDGCSLFIFIQILIDEEEKSRYMSEYFITKGKKVSRRVPIRASLRSMQLAWGINLMSAIASYNTHRPQPQRISYILAFIALIVSFQTLRSIYNRRQSRMINYTNIASASMSIPKIGLGTLGISPSEARPVIVSLCISVLYIPLLVC